MAEYGEWNRKGAVLSDVTAQKGIWGDPRFHREGYPNRQT